MGKKKFDQIQLVPNKNQRNVTYSKRKRGILKKAIELSMLCGQDIFLVIFDKQKQKLIEFRSSMEFDTKIVDSLTQKDIALHFKHEVYNNTDYSRFL
jgi:histidinol phosphatase-like enzyme